MVHSSVLSFVCYSVVHVCVREREGGLHLECSRARTLKLIMGGKLRQHGTRQRAL